MKNPDFSHINAVFFDLDGTLIDTAPDFIAAVNNLRVEHRLSPLPAEAIRPYVSEGAGGLIKACFDISDENDFQKARLRLLDHYHDVDHQHSRLFDYAEEFLDKLEAAKIPWGIVTNKPERFATPLIQKLQLQDRLICLLCPDHVAEKKPHPESLFLAASMAQIPAQECFYFGDHLRDIQAGQSATMLTASVGFGYFPLSENPLDWNADYHFNSFEEIQTAFFDSAFQPKKAM